jgi:hypothetical protein
MRRPCAVHALLAGVLLVQAGLSLRLHNTAFQDEALYLTAGRVLNDNIAHGVPADQYGYTHFFSGSPYLYPLAINVVDSAGGLAAARAVSLCLMLGATALIHGSARTLWDEKTGLCAAGVFAVAQSTQMLGNFATYDACAVFLLALLARLVTGSAARPWLLFPAVPLAALTVGVKYASALYLPTLCAMAVLVARTSWPRALARGTAFAMVAGGVVFGLLVLLGAGTALETTTTGRISGISTTPELLAATGRWLGPWIIAAAAGAILAGTARRPDIGSRARAVLLAIVLFTTLLLAPAYHLHLRTDVSLSKHVGYGLVFAAPLAGLALAWLSGRRLRFPLPAIAVSVALLWTGTHEAERQYSSWVDTTLLHRELHRVVPPDGKVLTEVADVPAYYLADRTAPRNIVSFYYLLYKNLTGPDAYNLAVADGYFDVIVLNRQASYPISLPLETRLRDNPAYRMVAKMPYRSSQGTGDYEVWMHLPT